MVTLEEQQEKKKLLAEGFPDWSKKDFRSFCSRCVFDLFLYCGLIVPGSLLNK